MLARLEKGAGHAVESLSPQMVLDMIEAGQIIDAGHPLREKYGGEIKTLEQQAIKITSPMRFRTRDPLKDFEYKAKNLYSVLRDRESDANRAYYDWWEQHGRYSVAEEKGETAEKRLMEFTASRLDEYVDAAYTLDYTYEEIYNTLDNAGFSQEDLDFYFDTRASLGYGAFLYEPPTTEEMIENSED